MVKQLLASWRKKIQKRVRKFRSAIHNRSVIAKWRKAGSPYPSPHEYRQELLKAFATKYKTGTLIETGTFHGQMVEALQDVFNRIYSIELNIDHYLNAKEKFYFLDHIEIIKGESSEQLHALISDIREPALFWLDTHAWLEKGTTEFSILDELKTILGSKPLHIVLINDARLFTGEKGYPTLIGLRNYIASVRPAYQFEVEDDVIRLYDPDLVKNNS